MTSFRFDFGGDDIQDNKADDVGEVYSSSEVEPELLLPALHSMRDLLSRLPSLISYAMYSVSCPIPTDPSNVICLPKRELYDIRAQSIVDDDLSKATLRIPGLSTEDLQPRIYEGGFKTWECAVDLAEYLGRAIGHESLQFEEENVEIIELGAGTALPSSFLLHHFMAHHSFRSCRMILADYNVDVLALATMANLLLTSFAAKSESNKLPGDLEITPSVVSNLTDDLSSRGISVMGISGAWGRSMADLITKDQNDGIATSKFRVILASETIYSPLSIREFVVTLLAVLEESSSPSIALIAAKKVYFGVGGSIEEFGRVLHDLGGASTVVWSSSEGIGRCILEVRLRR